MDLPPIKVNAARQNSFVMETIAAAAHLIAPVQPAAVVPRPALARPKRQTARCFRCGLKRSGVHHTSKVKRTTQEYCTVPREQRLNGWIVPNGYEVNDWRSVKDSRAIRRDWRRHREANNIQEHPEFEDW